MSYNNGPKIVTNGLVLYLDAANNRSIVSGSNTWFDLSRNNNTGSLINGPAYSSGNGGNIVFDGSNDYVSCGAVLNFGGPTSVGTICAVSKGSGDIFSNQRPGVSNLQHGWMYISVTQTKLRLYIDAYDNSPYGEFFEVLLSSTPYLSLIDQWNFYSVTINRLTNTYILGINDYFTTITRSFSVFNYNNFNVIEIGRTNNSTYSTTYFTGNIAQVSVYNRALSAAEVRQNYHASKGRFGL